MAVKTETRDRMIQAALDLFHLQGVKGTSIDEILARSGTGKSQFAHYFKTKDGLVHAVLQYLHVLIRDGKAGTGYRIRSWEDLEGWFDQYIRFQREVHCERSCPMATIGNDLAADQELLRQDIRLFLEWSGGQLARFFAERKAAGELSAAADPDALAALCLTVMQGGMLLSKIRRDTTTFERAAEQALAYIRSLRKGF